MIASIWKFLSPVLKPIWGVLFKFVPYLFSFAFGRKTGSDKERIKYAEKNVERYKKANEIQSRPLLSARAVADRLRIKKK